VITNKRYVEVFWKSPKDCSSIKGSIGGYAVSLTGVSAWANGTEPKIMIIRNKLSARCENLIPYTQYQASVFVKRENGATNPALSLNVNFTTLQDGESYTI
jgi:hypothetical protein